MNENENDINIQKSIEKFYELKRSIKTLVIRNDPLIDINYYYQSQIVWNKNMNIEKFNDFLDQYIKIINLLNNDKLFRVILDINYRNIMYIRFLLKIYNSTIYLYNYYMDDKEYKDETCKNIFTLIRKSYSSGIDRIEQKYFLET
jgi:hypothetical protein